MLHDVLFSIKGLTPYDCLSGVSKGSAWIPAVLLTLKRSDLVDLLSIYRAASNAGVGRVGVADTVGCASPRQVYVGDRNYLLLHSDRC